MKVAAFKATENSNDEAKYFDAQNQAGGAQAKWLGVFPCLHMVIRVILHQRCYWSMFLLVYLENSVLLTLQGQESHQRHCSHLTSRFFGDKVFLCTQSLIWPWCSRCLMEVLSKLCRVCKPQGLAIGLRPLTEAVWASPVALGIVAFAQFSLPKARASSKERMQSLKRTFSIVFQNHLCHIWLPFLRDFVSPIDRLCRRLAPWCQPCSMEPYGKSGHLTAGHSWQVILTASPICFMAFHRGVILRSNWLVMHVSATLWNWCFPFAV